MATSIQVHLGDYLHTIYRPDREFVDGELLERNVGKFEHSRIQALLAGWFMGRERTFHLMVVTEQRVQVSPSRVRIPDVALVSVGPHPDVLLEPPALVIEILSPDDTYSDMQERAGDYLRMGVESLWIIDPATRSGKLFVDGTWTEAAQLTAGDTISLDLAALFDSMERAS